VADRLAEAVRDPSHAFWPDDVCLLHDGVLDWQHVLGHRQVTDNCLLALAVRRQGRFVTFDGRVNCAAVRGAKAKHLMVLA
jgi:predicted nucleic acid-binding protein